MSVLRVEERFVLSNRVYEVRVVSADDLRSAVVAVTLDGRSERTLTVAGWRGVALGASDETGYFWSARELVVLPDSVDAPLGVVSVDEDLLIAFRVGDGWLLVCETSIRRLVQETQTARVELGDVVETALWEGETLVVRDVRGITLRLTVDGDRLIS